MCNEVKIYRLRSRYLPKRTICAWIGRLTITARILWNTLKIDIALKILREKLFLSKIYTYSLSNSFILDRWSIYRTFVVCRFVLKFRVGDGFFDTTPDVSVTFEPERNVLKTTNSKNYISTSAQNCNKIENISKNLKSIRILPALITFCTVIKRIYSLFNNKRQQLSINNKVCFEISWY